MAGPLEGLLVLDHTRLLPGPYCTMFLADGGAEVIRVEEVTGRRKAFAATAGPSPKEGPDYTDLYVPMMRNKKSITLNLRLPEGRALFHKLAEKADVVVDEWRPGVAKRLGVDYDTLRKTNPGLIYCTLSGYGQTGPYAMLPGYDTNYQAAAGLLAGGTGGTYLPIGDLAGGSMPAVIGILMALHAREKTGRGQFIDISLSDGLLSMVAGFYGAGFFYSGKVPGAGTRFTPVFETKDKKLLCVTPGEPHIAERFFKALGLENMTGRGAEESNAAIRDVIKTRTRDEWMRILTEADTCVSRANTVAEALAEDPQFRHRGLYTEKSHPVVGKVKSVANPIRMSETPLETRAFPSLYGEHTDEVLQRFGYDANARAALRRNGVIK